MTVKTSTVNIAFKTDLLRQIDKIAAEEDRSRSELIREAARMYIERKNRWNSIFETIQSKASGNAQITQEDVHKEIQLVRSKRKRVKN